MLYRQRRALAAAATGAAALLVTLAACGSSSGNGATSDGSTKKPATTITIGVLTDVTGPASSGNKTSIDGVKAGVVYAARQGYTIKYVIGDTATNPATALSAAQKMVTQDHVLAVIASSAIALTATGYLTAHNIPVIGIPEDGPEWTTSKNMFPVTGPLDQTFVATTTGAFLKKMGVTSVASIGYSVSPQSSEAASASAESARRAGIKVGYLNAKFPFGSTDVGAVVLAMKAAGIDGFTGLVDPNTSFAILTGLHDQGVDIKAALMPVGYGGDLTQAGPGAIQAAQGAYFALSYQPVELNTPATRQFESDLKAARVTGEPTLAQYTGYSSVGLLVRALKGTAANPTQASLIASLSTIHNWDALGLFGSQTADPNADQPAQDQCLFMAQLEGNSFKTVPGAEPICGKTIPGVKVAPAS
ncbi:MULTISPECIES: ABC transporter substrate-binding protein [unclassified Frankia]|uniref:ABC transporter substrate-binding protein n=1 Tax=unclassified Frankia TaxID=2632575 RepID=UPI0027DDD398|nr:MULTISPECIES: ABC transporter substrate-binding protein [unclassified Frankia]